MLHRNKVRISFEDALILKAPALPMKTRHHVITRVSGVGRINAVSTRSFLLQLASCRSLSIPQANI